MSSVLCVDKDGKEHLVRREDLCLRVSAYGIVVDDSKVLLLPQYSGYDLPGGGIELGETPQEAVIREVKEETGLTVKVIKKADFESNYFLSYEGKAWQSILLYFVCEYIGGEISTDGFDESEKLTAKKAEWINLSDLNEISVASSVDYRPVIGKIVA